MEAEIYYFMHKNIEVSTFMLDGNNVTGIRINGDAVRYLPAMYRENISGWLHDRGIPDTRQGLQESDRKSRLFRYMIDNLALSLTDCYWIKPADSDYTWENINLFQKNFRESMTLDMDYGEQKRIAGRTNFVPSASLKGSLKKKWLIDEHNSRILVKGNASNSCVQSISEVLATEIYRRQPMQVGYTEYQFIDMPSGTTTVRGCYAKAFTTEKLELIHAYDIVSDRKKPNDMNYFQFYKKILRENDVESDDIYDMQIMVDFIITNTDRHFNNFGVLRDSDTLRFVAPAPIFDSGNSMFYNESYVPAGKELLNISITSLYKKEVKMLSQVGNRGILDVGYLPSADEIYKLLLEDGTMDADRREQLLEAYDQKIIYLLHSENQPDT